MLINEEPARAAGEALLDAPIKPAVSRNILPVMVLSFLWAVALALWQVQRYSWCQAWAALCGQLCSQLCAAAPCLFRTRPCRGKPSNLSWQAQMLSFYLFALCGDIHKVGLAEGVQGGCRLVFSLAIGVLVDRFPRNSMLNLSGVLGIMV